MATWPEWNTDIDWVRLDGPFTAGTRGVLKPAGGPKVNFVIDVLIPESEFVDVSLLLGARLTFTHIVSVNELNKTMVEVSVTITGPLRAVWARILGKGIAGSLQNDLDRLTELVESER